MAHFLLVLFLFLSSIAKAVEFEWLERGEVPIIEAEESDEEKPAPRNTQLGMFEEEQTYELDEALPDIVSVNSSLVKAVGAPSMIDSIQKERYIEENLLELDFLDKEEHEQFKKQSSISSLLEGTNSLFDTNGPGAQNEPALEGTVNELFASESDSEEVPF